MQALLRAGEPVRRYRYDGLWFDIGRHDDYEQAVAAWLDAASNDDGEHIAPAVEKALFR